MRSYGNPYWFCYQIIGINVKGKKIRKFGIPFRTDREKRRRLGQINSGFIRPIFSGRRELLNG